MKNFCKNYGITINQFKGIDKIGGSLYLRSLTSIPEGFNPTVGGYLDLRSNLKSETKTYNLNILSWQHGKYVLVDDIFCEVIKKRGNVYKVKKPNTSKIFYIVSDGQKFAHGETVKEAKEDLMFKISNRNKSDFEHLTLESELTFENAIECYRVITGACSFGTKDFVINRLNTKKKAYKISEIIQLTKGEYQSETFKRFFKS